MKLFKNEHLKIASIALFFGAIWGILEATLGSVLHFEGIAKTFLSSSIIMLPIAYFLMGGAYKASGKIRAMLYAGLVAASIKMFAFFIPGIQPQYVINPAVSIVLESLMLVVFVKVIKPENILSVKSIAVVVLANIAFRMTFTLYQLATVVPFGATSFTFVDGALLFNEAGFVKFNLTQFALSSLYTIALGGIGYLVIKPFKNKNVNWLTNLVSNPITAVLLSAVAVTLTIVL